MKEAFDFLRGCRDVAFATVGGGSPRVRVFQVMRQSDGVLWFATSPHKSVYGELLENPCVELLSLKGDVSVRVAGRAVFDVHDEVCREIYNDNPVLRRLYANYSDLVYFRLDISSIDYYDLRPTPPVLRHFDASAGRCVDLNPLSK